MSSLRGELAAKDAELERVVKDANQRAACMQHASDGKFKALLDQFRTDMAIVDKEVHAKRVDYRTETEQLRLKLQQVTGEAKELGGLLEAAVKSDSRKEALIREMKVAYEGDLSQVKTRTAEIERERAQIEVTRKQMREEQLRFGGEVEEAIFKLKTADAKIKQQ